MTPSIMKSKLCVVDDEQIKLFEEIANSDMVYWLGEEQFEILDELIYLDYIVVDNIGRAEVPVDVKQAYDTINTETFHSKRKKIVWALKCLNVMNVLYGIAPIKVFRKVFRRNPEFRAESDDCMEIFYRIPLDKNPCTVVEDKIVYRGILQDGLYKKIEERQESKKFYIPTLEEIEDYAEHGYFSKAPDCKT